MMMRKLISLILVILFCLFGFDAKVLAAADEVHYTTKSPTEVSISWRGSESTFLLNGKTLVQGKTPSPVPYSSAGPFWEAKLTGLAPNTVYHYLLGGVDYTFKTAPSPGSANFSVEVIADVGDTGSYKNVGIISEMIAGSHPDLVLIPGDLTYGNAHGQSHVDQHFNDVMVWSGKGTAYMPAWGNHEWDKTTDDLRNYKGRFDLVNPQTSPGCSGNNCGGEDWYWFDYGNTRFIAYPEPTSGAWSDWQKKASTIMDTAQTDPNIKFIVTFGHRPAYSSGHHAGNTTLAGLIATLQSSHPKYVLNLNGHSHNYERSNPINGVVHITAGTGGSSLEQDGSCLWATCSQPSWSARRYMRHGVIKLDFTPSGINGSFICGPAGGGTNDISCMQGSVIDDFVIGKPGTIALPPLTSPSNPPSTPPTTSPQPSSAQPPTLDNYSLWFSHFGQSLSGGKSSGDFDQNGVVDGVDYVLWLTDFKPLLTIVPSPSPTPLVTNDNFGTIFTIPTVPKPSYLASITDPTFQTKITRISGDSGAAIATVGGNWPQDSRHHYQKDQPWSIDGKYIALDPKGMDQLILDGSSYQPVKVCNGSDDRWYPGSDPAKAHWRIDVSGQSVILRDVDTCSVKKTISIPIQATGFGQSEGNPSYDGNFLIANNTTSMVAVDLVSGRVGPTRDLTQCGMSDCASDWASISPSGKYAVVSVNDHPQVYDINRDANSQDYLKLTPRPILSSDTKLCGSDHDPAKGSIYDLGHADMTLNPFDSGEDVIIGQVRGWCKSTVSGVAMGQVVMVRLRDGQVTTLTKPGNEAQAHHISTRSYARPGWAYVTYYTAVGKRFSDEIIAVKLDGSFQVERLAHTHSSAKPYRNEEHAVPSPDGKRVIFASGWDSVCGVGCGSASNPQAYVINLR